MDKPNSGGYWWFLSNVCEFGLRDDRPAVVLVYPEKYTRDDTDNRWLVSINCEHDSVPVDDLDGIWESVVRSEELDKVARSRFVTSIDRIKP